MEVHDMHGYEHKCLSLYSLDQHGPAQQLVNGTSPYARSTISTEHPFVDMYNQCIMAPMLWHD